mmetsp:Transcript_34296/g.52554  ORF Transcript_34296/g.52554 Transcript_34296/m.52554 type:complete len:104 (-) Transcript_34296:120-431(-)
MLWNLYPYILVTFPVGWIFNILLLPLWSQTFWIELYWNAFSIVNIFVEIMLVPYYCVAFFFTIFNAMAARPMYRDFSAALVSLTGIEASKFTALGDDFDPFDQ